MIDNIACAIHTFSRTPYIKKGESWGEKKRIRKKANKSRKNPKSRKFSWFCHPWWQQKTPRTQENSLHYTLLRREKSRSNRFNSRLGSHQKSWCDVVKYHRVTSFGFHRGINPDDSGQSRELAGQLQGKKLCLRFAISPGYPLKQCDRGLTVKYEIGVFCSMISAGAWTIPHGCASRQRDATGYACTGIGFSGPSRSVANFHSNFDFNTDFWS